MGYAPCCCGHCGCHFFGRLLLRLAVFFGDSISIRRLASAEVLAFIAKTSSQPRNQCRWHSPRLLERGWFHLPPPVTRVFPSSWVAACHDRRLSSVMLRVALQLSIPFDMALISRMTLSLFRHGGGTYDVLWNCRHHPVVSVESNRAL